MYFKNAEELSLICFAFSYTIYSLCIVDPTLSHDGNNNFELNQMSHVTLEQAQARIDDLPSLLSMIESPGIHQGMMVDRIQAAAKSNHNGESISNENTLTSHDAKQAIRHLQIAAEPSPSDCQAAIKARRDINTNLGMIARFLNISIHPQHVEFAHTVADNNSAGSSLSVDGNNGNSNANNVTANVNDNDSHSSTTTALRGLALVDNDGDSNVNANGNNNASTSHSLSCSTATSTERSSVEGE
jgi:hypothetical protein